MKKLASAIAACCLISSAQAQTANSNFDALLKKLERNPSPTEQQAVDKISPDIIRLGRLNKKQDECSDPKTIAHNKFRKCISELNAICREATQPATIGMTMFEVYVKTPWCINVDKRLTTKTADHTYITLIYGSYMRGLYREGLPSGTLQFVDDRLVSISNY